MACNMKLLKPKARLLAFGRGNVKYQSAPGEVYVDAFSDGGSTPPASTNLIAGRTPEQFDVRSIGSTTQKHRNFDRITVFFLDMPC